MIRPHSPILGPEDAPVTIVEFFDPACEACRAFHPVLDDIRESHPNQVRIVMRYAAFHEGSDPVIRLLEAARRQGLFEPVLRVLLETQPAWAQHVNPQVEIAWQAAAGVGLDLDRAQKIINDTEIDAVLEQDAADIKTVGVQRTPRFFVNGQPLQRFGAKELMEMVHVQLEAQ